MWLVLVVVLASCERAAPRRVKDDAGPPPADAKVYEPIDLVLAIDVSKSMEEPDVPLDRLEETKRATRAFVAAKQPQDRIAVVIFAQQTRVVTTLTTDAKLLDETLAGLEIGRAIPELGTAMGDGIALAVFELESSRAKRKAIVVFADGDSNMVIRYDVPQACALAKAHGLAIQTVLVGREGGEAWAIPADPKTLQEIATATGGTLHRASDPAAFDRAMQELRAKL